MFSSRLASWRCFSACRSRAPMSENQACAVSATIESCAASSSASRDCTRRSMARNSLRSPPKRSISQLASKPARQVSVRMPPGASGSWVLNFAFSRWPEAPTVGNQE